VKPIICHHDVPAVSCKACWVERQWVQSIYDHRGAFVRFEPGRAMRALERARPGTLDALAELTGRVCAEAENHAAHDVDRHAPPERNDQ